MSCKRIYRSFSMSAVAICRPFRCWTQAQHGTKLRRRENVDVAISLAELDLLLYILWGVVCLYASGSKVLKALKELYVFQHINSMSNPRKPHA